MRSACRRVWLITSNDNLDALRFYQWKGYRITAVHVGAIDDARRIKPSIPLVGKDGIAIYDEIELAKSLVGDADRLTVMTHNEAVVALYQKAGFQIEGTVRDTLFVDGRYVSEYMMAKLL